MFSILMVTILDIFSILLYCSINITTTSTQSYNCAQDQNNTEFTLELVVSNMTHLNSSPGSVSFIKGVAKKPSSLKFSLRNIYVQKAL